MNDIDPGARIADVMARFMALQSKVLPDDVMKRLHELREEESSATQRAVYAAYFDNLQRAVELDRPCCQDTGLPHFYVTAGCDFPHLGAIEGALISAVRSATEYVPLRRNAVSLFDGRNTEDNTGERMPWIHWDIVQGGGVKIVVYFSGAGCSLPGRAAVFKPSGGMASAVRFVLESVTELGMNACPPLIVGVGLGHSMDDAAHLSKLAVLRPLGTSHAHERGAELERRSFEALNGLGIGAQGLPGKMFVSAVHVESSARHTATFAAAVTVSCYAHRRGVIRFADDLSFEILSHRGASI